MRNLINLRHLNHSNVPSLEGMPPQLVGKDGESRVTEIGPSLHLQGTLCLSRLENVIDAEDAK